MKNQTETIPSTPELTELAEWFARMPVTRPEVRETEPLSFFDLAG